MKLVACFCVLLLSCATLNANSFFDDIGDRSDKHPIDIDYEKPKLPRVKVNVTDEVRDGKKEAKYDTKSVFPEDLPTESPTTEKLRTTTENVTTTQKVETSTAKTSTTTEKKSTTEVPATTEIPATTQKPKTTTSSVPIDPVTPPKVPVTTMKPNVAPSENKSHQMRWFFGLLFMVIFVVIVSLYAYKFYQNRQESAYQNL